MKTFSAKEAPLYVKNGYTGVVVLSKRGKITSLPPIWNVESTNCFTTVVKDPMTIQTKEECTNTTVKIAGIDVPMVNSAFKKPSTQIDDCFGNDNMEEHPYYDAVQEFNQYIKKYVAKVGEPTDGDTIAYLSGQLMIWKTSNILRPTMSLQNWDTKYVIFCYVNPADKKFGTLYQNCLKLFCAAVSNDPNLYNVIYESLVTDNLHGLNEETWTSFGAYKIRVSLDDKNCVKYLIMSYER